MSGQLRLLGHRLGLRGAEYEGFSRGDALPTITLIKSLIRHTSLFPLYQMKTVTEVLSECSATHWSLHKGGSKEHQIIVLCGFFMWLSLIRPMAPTMASISIKSNKEKAGKKPFKRFKQVVSWKPKKAPYFSSRNPFSPSVHPSLYASFYTVRGSLCMSDTIYQK